MGWIIPIFIVSTGSIIGIVFFDKKYEEALPYTGSAIIALLFLFGFFGSLLSGAYFLCIVAFFVYLVSGVYYFRRKKKFLQGLLSVLVMISGTVSGVAISIMKMFLPINVVWTKALVETVLYFINYYIQRTYIFIRGKNRKGSPTLKKVR